MWELAAADLCGRVGDGVPAGQRDCLLGTARIPAS